MKLVLILALLTIGPLSLQAQASEAEGGAVTGHVVLSDTRGPARMAKVSLALIPSEAKVQGLVDMQKSLQSPQTAPPAAKIREMWEKNLMHDNVVQTTTDLDGAFSFSGVPAGGYVLYAESPGYVSAAERAMVGAESGAGIERTLRDLPHVHIANGRIANVDLSVEHGGAISGAVKFEDGTPATELSVNIEPVNEVAQSDLIRTAFSQMRVRRFGAHTDDHGRYRIYGLAPGEYRVVVSVAPPWVMSSRTASFTPWNRALTFYAPGKLHAEEAQRIKITAGDDIDGVDFDIHIPSHRITGHILAATDQHPVNNGTVVAIDTSDKNLRFSSSVMPDGSFELIHLPSGTYMLKIDDASDRQQDPAKDGELGKIHTLRNYLSQSRQVVIGDSDVKDADLIVTAAEKVRTDLDNIFE